ncbi:MAG: hypothetical protein MRY63_13570 [Neomegalonema sp.]|nr:hypothetical protein [Neomegalonema sp.]
MADGALPKSDDKPTPARAARGFSLLRRFRDLTRQSDRFSRYFNDLKYSPARQRAPGIWRAIVLQAPRPSWTGIDAAVPEFHKLFAKSKLKSAELTDELNNPELDALIVWGAANSRQLNLARQLRPDLPIIHVGLGPFHIWVDGHIYFSVVLDWTGTYDNARRPNDLEDMLNHINIDRHAEALFAARKLRQRFSAHRKARLVLSQAQRIGIALQHTNDPRMRLGGPTTMSPDALIEACIETWPGAEVACWRHRDITTEQADDLMRIADERGLAQPTTSRAALFQGVDRLATHSAGIGLEALACGMEVHCWGTPYYAGWGNTLDHVEVPRRLRMRDLDELIAICAFLYPRWLGPGNVLVDMAKVIDGAQEIRFVD